MIILTNRQTREQAFDLVHTLLELQKGREGTSIKFASMLNEYYGLNVDWHFVLDVLEFMTNKSGQAQVIDTTIERRNIYLIN